MSPMGCRACAVGTNWLVYSVAAGESPSNAGLLVAGIVPATFLGGAVVALSCVAAWSKGYAFSRRRLYILVPFAPPLAAVYGLVRIPVVIAWLPKLFGF